MSHRLDAKFASGPRVSLTPLPTPTSMAWASGVARRTCPAAAYSASATPGGCWRRLTVFLGKIMGDMVGWATMNSWWSTRWVSGNGWNLLSKWQFYVGKVIFRFGGSRISDTPMILCEDILQQVDRFNKSKRRLRSSNFGIPPTWVECCCAKTASASVAHYPSWAAKLHSL